MDSQINLFGNSDFQEEKLVKEEKTEEDHPLAYRSRPSSFQELIGAEALLKSYPFLQCKTKLPSMIIFGPPGTGKTTLAHLVAKESSSLFFPFSAVLGGVTDLKKIVEEVLAIRQRDGQHSIIFIDEIHRFNKAQQDALLPRVESGDFTLIGATTENPRFVINRALLSRVHLVELSKISDDHLLKILEQTIKRLSLPHFPRQLLEKIVSFADGDARRPLNLLEIFIQTYNQGISESEWDKNRPEILSLLKEYGRDYDRKYNRHYDVISAFIKSLRGSDLDAAILWLAVMLDGGEDPLFIARRLVIFASEDVGNSDPWAILIATSVFEAVKSIGMPEARISLAQAVTYLASTVKSHASYLAIDEALEFVKSRNSQEVPAHLKNQSPDYKYPHDFENHFVMQKYSMEKIPQFYRPTFLGREKALLDRLKQLWQDQKKY